MKLYLTIDSKEIIKKYYIKQIDKEYAIIDTITLQDLYQYNILDKEDIYKKYLIEQDIEKQLSNIYISKRYKALIYIINNIDINFIELFNNYLKEKKIYFTEFNLIDYTMRIDRQLYDNFTNVI